MVYFDNKILSILKNQEFNVLLHWYVCSYCVAIAMRLYILTMGRKNIGWSSSGVHLSIPLNFTYRSYIFQVFHRDDYKLLSLSEGNAVLHGVSNTMSINLWTEEQCLDKLGLHGVGIGNQFVLQYQLPTGYDLLVPFQGLTPVLNVQCSCYRHGHYICACCFCSQEYQYKYTYFRGRWPYCTTFSPSSTTSPTCCTTASPSSTISPTSTASGYCGTAATGATMGATTAAGSCATANPNPGRCVFSKHTNLLYVQQWYLPLHW